MSTATTAERLDAAIAEFFSSWNIYSTLLVLLLVVFLTYPLLTGREPDTHPFLLARQAQIAPIRHSGESAVYRAIDMPHGYPLRAGLGVKDPGAPRWSSGRPGDLRDIWRVAVRGAVKEDGTPTGEKGKILTILGSEKVVDHQFEDLTLGINAIGQYVKRNNGQNVAVCLSNSVEMLSAIFGMSSSSRGTGLYPDVILQLVHSMVSRLSCSRTVSHRTSSTRFSQRLRQTMSLQKPVCSTLTACIQSTKPSRTSSGSLRRAVSIWTGLGMLQMASLSIHGTTW